MKRKLLFLILPALSTAVFSCTKAPAAPASEPENMTISGYWAVPGNLDRVFVFGGDGTYAISTSPSSHMFAEGVLDALATDFTPDGNRYKCTYVGDEYTLESFGTKLLATRISSTGYSFETPDGTRTLRLEKVLYFKGEAPEVSNDYSMRINGSLIQEGNDLVGLVTDSDSGHGIPGVVVSDGYNCAVTDANGVYQFKSSPGLSRIIFYSTPSEYQITLESSTSSIPRFYTKLQFSDDLPFCRNDFLLTPLPGGKETNWTFVAVGDPQCSSSGDAGRYETETLVDMSSFLSDYKNVYAMTMGDIIFDSNNVWNRMHTNMGGFRINGAAVPFFQVIGNHDKDATNNNDAYHALDKYIDQFGPVDYSYNRGDIHIVAMDDIPVTKIGTSTHSNNYTWSYSRGFSDEQIEWLRQDIELVQDKAGKGVFFCTHIPLGRLSDYNFGEVYKLLAPFREVHFMVGHTHYHRNLVYSQKASGGLPYYEHIHGAACGAWWSSNGATGKNSNITTTGGYAGYTVYDVEGPCIVDRVLKGTFRSPDAQMRVYDSEFQFPGRNAFLWGSLTNYGGSAQISCPGNETLTNCLIAEVFDDDSVNWKVEMYQGGNKIGNFVRMADGASCNMAVVAYFFNQCTKNTSSYSKTNCTHLWYFKTPDGGLPSDMKDWEVRATFTHPGSGKQHVYTVNKFTVDYTDFDL